MNKQNPLNSNNYGFNQNPQVPDLSKFKEIVIAGINQNDQLVYFKTPHTAIAVANLLVDFAKAEVLKPLTQLQYQTVQPATVDQIPPIE